jgi:glycosyltransferase involved in cell wall biosynthesis
MSYFDAKPPRATVVIPTRNRPEFLREAIEAIAAGSFADYEVRVMDQTDGDATERIIEEMHDSRLVYHRMRRNGACPARNLGAALARAEIVVFMDDDCCPRADWLERIVSAFDEDRDLQFIFGSLKAPDVDRRDGWYPEFLPSAELNTPARQRKIATLGAGANMSARKSFLRRIGGFDELLGPRDVSVNSSDTSICFKVLRSGEAWRADGAIEVIHKNGFRRHDELTGLFRMYAREMGIDYGRFVRRGDMYALRLFLIEEFELARGALARAVRGKRPQGARDVVERLRGFMQGLRLAGHIGYVDGAQFRRMEVTGELDP